ncbi:hypothetical protein M430DRAFT_34472 [Amorphotheca resinae ATCC 22711]|uniref:Uncharacterized protein n=1 Tax=Amorphotheca resinae ATCC 22711 TaxID=857342 RepID=A0A2T3B363_AMORE|nr:hypothetical protein M430DRAFT_34472 [Amorphotheca resinae ATCC 22711]PSS20082.1 hypothetical protein M430DRAFT_34472 [Amorphotheca resinae ATCC 22711]
MGEGFNATSLQLMTASPNAQRPMPSTRSPKNSPNPPCYPERSESSSATVFPCLALSFLSLPMRS